MGPASKLARATKTKSLELLKSESEELERRVLEVEQAWIQLHRQRPEKSLRQFLKESLMKLLGHSVPDEGPRSHR